MKKKIPFFALTILFIAMLPTLVFAQDTQTKKVTFPAGKSSTVITGTVKGYKTIDYVVSGSENQNLQVSLRSKSTAIYFNVMPPGSSAEAIYIGESDGTNKFGGTLSASGAYKIRVFLVRSAARRNETANFSLSISLSGASHAAHHDAKVPGTQYNATGKLDTALGSDARVSSNADFGIIRNSDGSAKVHVSIKGLIPRVLVFSHGEWSCESNSVIAKKRGDEWEIILNDYEHYFISQYVISGG